MCDIEEMPSSHGLETPLHPYRQRAWQPSVTVSNRPPTTSPTAILNTVDEVAPMSSVANEPSLSPAISAPSPSTFIECDTQSSPTISSTPVALPRSRQSRLRDEEICRVLNYGSEPSDGESDDEDLVAPLIPRTFRCFLETPMDTEDIEGQPSFIVEAVPTSTTERPWAVNDFEWSAFPNPPIPPESRREMFCENNVGPTTQSVDPYDIFIAIWDRQFMEYIASETNRYAQQVTTQMLDNNKLFPNSRISQWRDTTADELYVYFGLILGMGVVVKSRLEEYWSSSPDLFVTPGFRAHMSLNRFMLLNKCLHFRNNEDMCALRLNASEAKLFKIQPVIDFLNTAFQNLYNLNRNISLDESLLQWKGWLDINQLIPNKAATVGIKTYEICESQTGYLWRFEVHAYKKSPLQQTEDILQSSTPAIVLRLVHGLENRGHTLWMDNFYNSPCLARRLKSLGFDCVGTLRTNRLFVPETLHNLTKNDMRPGEITGLTSGDIDVMVWRDRNRVAMLSTYHGNGVQSIRGSTKPILILDYNIMMGGVDKKDQMLAMYPIERKRTKIWYKKLFRRLLNVSVLNAYIVHKHNSSSPLSHRNFRIRLIKQLLSKHSAALPLLPKIPQNRLVFFAGDISPIEIMCHLPAVCEEKDIPYCYTPSRKDIGAAMGTMRGCVMVLVKEHDDYKDLYDEVRSEIKLLGHPI
ncbi:hypothetical protein HW555_012682 [Spodoptera exigua]|uniref:PiggyBac transposable element-derived protein 4 n=1 Tax=Spodoptera exigua TaxID=7107 RepID=A0A835G4P4_SPOEX|nr:hypothetical protein HW555_012682 [Spodoptera exigua]